MTEQTIKKCLCGMCSIFCGLDVWTENGKIVKVTHMEEHLLKPLCPRPQGLIEWVYSPERLKTPLRKINGKFEPISWDEAFDHITKKLTHLKNEWGGRSLAIHTGNPFIATHVEKVARRFVDLYGSPNFTSGASFCYYARTLGHSLTLNYGRLNLGPHYHGTKCAVIWGHNPEESVHLQFGRLNALHEKGVKFIVIDPRTTTLAKWADIHAQIRPGTDCALALGLLNVIIEEKLYDGDFVRQWTSGFDKLVEHVKQYPPEKIQDITWVPADRVREIARTYANNKPANISQGIAMDHSTNGVQASRAIAILVSITGNLDVRGGNIWPDRKGFFTNLRVPEKVNDGEGISNNQFPVFNQFAFEQTAVCLPDAILEGKPYPIKSLIVAGSNPVLIWPNSARTMDALKKLELLVVMDLFMTATARFADIVLPCTSFLERQAFKDYRSGGGLPLVALGEKAIEPVGNCMEDWRIWAELGKRMGYEGYFPWNNSQELIQHLLEPSGISIEELKQLPGGKPMAKWEERRYLKEGKFNTPSGKVEIYSETLEKYGYSPLPTYVEPTKSHVSKPDLANDYPLVLISGIKTRYFTHSQFRGVPSLRSRMKEPFLDIHTRTAGKMGIKDGDLVRVESSVGSIEIKARVIDDIAEKVVSAQHGWEEANINMLVDDKIQDPISGYPAFRQVLCRVRKVM